MRIAFLGTPLFAVPTLLRLLEAGHDVAAVIAQPSKPAGRGQQLVDPPTVEIARKHGLPVLQPKAVKSGPFPERFEALQVEVAVVVAYGRILTPRLLQAPRRGCVNVHGSLLPRYRGAAPIQWAIARGETETGITTMKMDEGLDTGDMLLRRATPIHPEETAAQLAARLADIGGELAVETLAHLDDIVPTPQDSSRATFAPPLGRDDGHVDWSRPARELGCLVRAMTPWPGAWTELRGQTVRLHRVRPLPDCPHDAPPGTLIDVRKRLLVATGQGALDLLEIQLPCKNRQDGVSLVNGARLQIGEAFR